jgi:predicted transcriptional regulator
MRSQALWHVRPDDTVFDALKLLAEREVGAVMVMDQGKLIGVLSERDYTRKIALQGKSSKDTKVSDIMTKNVFVVTPDTRTRTCMALMSEKRIRHLPVVDGLHSTVMHRYARSHRSGEERLTQRLKKFAHKSCALSERRGGFLDANLVLPR